MNRMQYMRSWLLLPLVLLFFCASQRNPKVVTMPAAAPPAITLTGHTDQVNAVTFSPDGKVLASAADDDSIKLWDVGAGKCLATINVGHSIMSLACSLDGKVIVSAGYSHDVKLWDASTGKPKGALRHPHNVFGVARAPARNTIATACFDGVVRLWDLETQKQVLSLRGGGDDTHYGVAFSPDGETVAAGGWDKTLRFWNAASGQLKVSATGHTAPIYSVAFSPKGGMCATGGGEFGPVPGNLFREDIAELKLWDAATRKELRSLKGHKKPIHAVAFSPDGKLLASGGGNQYEKEGELLIWDVESGKLLGPLSGHTDLVRAVAFSPDGQFLASASHDRTVRLWNVKESLDLLKR